MVAETLFSMNKAAQIIDVSTNTLKRWYKWYENEDFKKPDDLILPEYRIGDRGQKFFTMEDIPVLQQFKEDLQGKYRGCMAEFNAYWQWGQRGTVILENKRKKEEKEQNEQT